MHPVNNLAIVLHKEIGCQSNNDVQYSFFKNENCFGYFPTNRDSIIF